MEHISTFAPGTARRADDTASKLQPSLTHIAPCRVDCTIYTDGSATDGTRNGGAAAFITIEPPVQAEVLTTIKTKYRTFTCSYEEEGTDI